MSIPVGLDDDLSAMLLNNDVDPEVPEGTEYYLPAGSSYRVTPFALMKGFRLAGSRDGVKPIVVLEGSWSIAEGSYLSSLEFDNIEFRHEANNNYFMNTSKAYTIENVSFVNCDFISLRRGFWRHQSANTKYIMNLEMEGCRFEGCGWQTSAFGMIHLQSFDKDNGVSYDQVDRAVFRNCTFSNDNNGTDGYGWGNLFYAPYMDKPIDLEYKNVTIYNYSRNQRLINIESAVSSKLVMEGILLASPCGDLFAIGANTTTTFSNNYTTADYALGGKNMNATDLKITAAELFADPANGDLTIKDTSSPIVSNRAGDTRWLP